MDTHNIKIIIAIPVFLILILVEYLAMRKKNPNYYRLNDAITNLNIGAGHVLSKIFIGALLLGVYNLVYSIRIINIPDGIFSYIFCIFAYDFFFYWAHRLGHEVNFFWGAHGVHHQSEDYNLSVALRQSWLHAAVAFFIFLPIPFLGVSPKVFFIVLSINSFYQFWIHTNLIDRMPKWFEFIFNSPAHHRVHHARNKKYIDKNHAGMFIIWDKMFGTFIEEEDRATYGITKPLNSWNPFWANIEYYVGMFQLSKKFSNWKDKLRLIIAKPGWQPNELGGQLPIPEIDNNYKKYDKHPLNIGLNIYVFTQFMLIMVGIMFFMYHVEALTTFYKYFCFGLLMLSILSCGAILEQKAWAKSIEIGRLFLIVFGLNTLYFQHYSSWFYLMLIISSVLTIYFTVWFILNTNNINIIKYKSA